MPMLGLHGDFAADPSPASKAIASDGAFRTERGVPGENNPTAVYEIESEFHKLITSYVGERAA